MTIFLLKMRLTGPNLVCRPKQEETAGNRGAGTIVYYFKIKLELFEATKMNFRLKIGGNSPHPARSF